MIDERDLTLEGLRRIAATVGERRGWDFSRMRDDRDPVPWDYLDVVRQYLEPRARVLDIGTGGGERFRSLASGFGSGIGIDASAEMVRVAREDTPAELAGKVAFEEMRAEQLRFGGEEFDVVLARHASLAMAEVARVLRPGGRLITQQVGPDSTRAICRAFGCGPGGTYGEPLETLQDLARTVEAAGLQVEAQAQYDVRYFVPDLESFVFWLQAVPLPENFDIEKHWREVRSLVRDCWALRGVESNEQRLLLVARKP
ncbi:MAG: class I SAM-dependent methyltransferase [Anaerolineae bacterium]